ncbi:restriction endonuclease [Nocardioides sp. SYSU DS0651]|uniref:restriction endonuclease n=1 Tax=Nocardioides sp. SYSU DS0651 TaxID=3415955 RepID=UPI003F4C825E
MPIPKSYLDNLMSVGGAAECNTAAELLSLDVEEVFFDFPPEFMAACGGPASTALDFLADVPDGSEAWAPQTDTSRAVLAVQAAVRASEESETVDSRPAAVRLADRLAELASPSVAAPAEEFTPADRLVFLEGTFEADRDVDATGRWCSSGGVCGRLSGAHGLFRVHGLDEDLAAAGRTMPGMPGQPVWLVGRLVSEPDGQLAVDVLRAGTDRPWSEVAVWPGRNVALRVLRAVAVTELLEDLAAYTTPDTVPYLLRLVHAHAPLTGTSAPELVSAGDAVRWLRWLHAGNTGAPAGSAGAAGAATVRGRPVLPAARLVKGHAAAEEYAAEVLGSLGFSRVRRTPTGADGGVDVVADGLVCQVKMEALPTGRDRVQALHGIAALEEARAVFFSLSGYTKQAVGWADRAGMALLEFETDGSVRAVNPAGRDLLAHGSIPS